MKIFDIKKYALFIFLLSSASGFSQSRWLGKLTLSDLDCEKKEACYQVEIKGVAADSWKLGDQNYRFFFDAEHVSVNTVKSLLPEGPYGKAQIQEVLEIANSGQEDYSPLDLIDDNLGFLDVSILSYTKEAPDAAVEISESQAAPVLEICLIVSDDMLAEGQENAMNLYFSRPETAGQITKQYTVVSEINGINHTQSTTPLSFSDINYYVGTDAQLGKLCSASSTDNILNQPVELTVYPNPVLNEKELNYRVSGTDLQAHEVSIYDINNRLISTYRDLRAGNTSVKIDNKLSSGTYFFQLRSDKHLINKSFTVIGQ